MRPLHDNDIESAAVIQAPVTVGSVIGPALATDLPALAALEQLCFAEPRSLATLEHEHQDPITRHLVLRDTSTKTVLAYMSWQCVLDEGQIGDIAVHPDHRRQGLATALLRTCISQMPENGLQRLTLEVRSQNLPALRTYTALGFYEVGRRPRYYTKPDDDAILMDWTRPPQSQ